ncbi:hypothetical protein BHE74_00025385 [Ensete ventricosum]|nr:hypothetical protein BHE74_00025385 [Ensete ventricosum]
MWLWWKRLGGDDRGGSRALKQGSVAVAEGIVAVVRSDPLGVVDEGGALAGSFRGWFDVDNCFVRGIVSGQGLRLRLRRLLQSLRSDHSARGKETLMVGATDNRWNRGRRVRKCRGLRLRTEVEDGVTRAGNAGSVNVAAVRGDHSARGKEIAAAEVGRQRWSLLRGVGVGGGRLGWLGGCKKCCGGCGAATEGCKGAMWMGWQLRDWEAGLAARLGGDNRGVNAHCAIVNCFSWCKTQKEAAVLPVNVA